MFALHIYYFCNRKKYLDDTMPVIPVNWWAVAGVVLGAVVANLVKWGIPSINGMVVAAACFLLGQALRKK